MKTREEILEGIGKIEYALNTLRVTIMSSDVAELGGNDDTAISAFIELVYGALVE